MYILLMLVIVSFCYSCLRKEHAKILCRKIIQIHEGELVCSLACYGIIMNIQDERQFLLTVCHVKTAKKVCVRNIQKGESKH